MFLSNEHLEAAYYEPPDSMISLDEWEGQGYTEHESIPGGSRGKREIELHLPLKIWLPRAATWARALVAMSHTIANATIAL